MALDGAGWPEAHTHTGSRVVLLPLLEILILSLLATRARPCALEPGRNDATEKAGKRLSERRTGRRERESRKREDCFAFIICDDVRRLPSYVEMYANFLVSPASLKSSTLLFTLCGASVTTYSIAAISVNRAFLLFLLNFPSTFSTTHPSPFAACLIHCKYIVHHSVWGLC